MRDTIRASGERRQRRKDMTALVQSASRSTALPAIAALVIGLGIVTIAGFAHASALHDSAHDVRHADGFPCH